LGREHIPLLSGEALYTVAVALANKILPSNMSWNSLPNVNSMKEYINPNGFMTYEKLIDAVKHGN